MEQRYKLLNGDCLDKLKELEDNSIDSIVTDPPYGLAFMGKKWDYDVPSQDIWEECIRVLKPGGHLLAFAGSRTYHRMAVRIEDAGFDIRDQIMWIYGSGFPKSHNIGKSIDKLQGNQRQVVGTKRGQGNIPNDRGNWGLKPNTDVVVDVGQSDYEGWGTALKPAHEPIVMARKPFKGSVAENVLEWGTGGINVDDCRISVDMDREGSNAKRMNKTYSGSSAIFGQADGDTTFDGYDKGRFPANIILDEEAGKILDEQAPKVGNAFNATRKQHTRGGGGHTLTREHSEGENNGVFDGLGGASRFFYCPKVSKKERDEGVGGEAKPIKGRDEGQDKMSNPYKLRPAVSQVYAANQTTSKIGANPNKPTEPRANIHPTVKPTDLMTYLIRLVTPKDGIVLDPFMGSGSTGKAAMREGFQFVGIEREQEYMEIAEQRIDYEYNKRKFF